jgi:uncharacterized membrane protein
MWPRNQRSRSAYVLILLFLLYLVARLLQLYAGKVPALVIVVFHVLPPAAFAFIHGKITYRLRGTLVFNILCLGIGTFFESLSLRTGFPFGHYFFTGLMGPQLLRLPVLLALAYVGMCYLSWIVALLILGYQNKPLSGRQIVLLPLIAGFVMVAWDLAMDPVWANIDHAWVWKSGGSYFGVPVSNFLGWYLTVYVFYQLFALYLRRRPTLSRPPAHWRLPVLFYGASAVGNLLLAVPSETPAVVTDPSGAQWMVSGIIKACILVSIFVMGSFTLMAWARIADIESSLSIVDTQSPQGDQLLHKLK